MSLTNNEILNVAAALDSLEPGFLPEQIFYSLSRLSVLTAAEVVPLRRTLDGGYEVLLTRRPDLDPFFGGLVHCPGQIYRPGDSLSDRPKKVVQEELSHTTVESEPRLVPDTFIHDYGRGPVIERIYYIFVSSSEDGDFYPVDDLPNDLLASHDKLIRIVINYLNDMGASK